MNKTYNWKRFWCPRGGSVITSPEGFLMDFGKYNQSIVTFDGIAHHDCLVLLGEPGMGKSIALKKEWEELKETLQNDGNRTVWLDLRSFGTEDRLVKAIFASSEFDQWVKGSHHLHLFLDSLDECLLGIETVATLLVDELRNYPVQRLSLRIASRSAEWPGVLEDGLRELWGNESVSVYELVQLRREDVEEAARAEGIVGTKAFLQEVAIKSAGPLAAKPITLNLLLNLWRKNQQLPETQTELYERGCRLLCEEEKQTMRRSLSAMERMVVAARIAAVTIFCNRFAIWTAIDRGDCPDEDVTVHELSGETEQTTVKLFEVTESAVRETLDTGLFSLRGTNRLGWAHQTYAEFLAAWYLKHLSLDPTDILRLITPADEPEGKIAPQLHESAAWIAGMFPDVFRQLMRNDAMVLLRSDVASADAAARSQLTAALLGLFAEEKERDHWEIRKHYHKLKHPELANQLRPFITDRNLNVIVRRAAIDIAEECQITQLQSELATIALDESDNLIVRAQAAAAVSKIGDSTTKARLKPLAMGRAGEDDRNELRGYSLIAVWPDHLTAEELFSTLTSPDEGFTGSYSIFLSLHLTQNLKASDLPHALRWVIKGGMRHGFSNPFGTVVDEILLQAWYSLDEPEVLDSFALVALARLQAHEEIVEQDYENKLLKEFLDNDAKRRKVLEKIFPMIPNPDEGWVWFTRSKAFFVSLKDIFWLLSLLSTSDQPNEHRLIARLIDRELIHGVPSPDELTALQSACRLFPVFGSVVSSRFRAVELGSAEAARLKGQWEEMHRRGQRRESPDEEPPLLSPSPAERIDLLLGEFENGELDAWWQLHLVMTLEPDSKRYGDEYEPDLTKLTGWKAADTQTRERMLAAAKKYLFEGDPKTKEWQGTKIFFCAALAGYKAMFLLHRNGTAFTSELPTLIWRKWAPIIASYPVIGSVDNSAKETHRLITSLAYKHAPQTIIESLLLELDRADNEGGYFRVPDRFADCWDEQFNQALREKVRAWDDKPVRAGSLLEQLLDHHDLLSREYAETLLTNSLNSETEISQFVFVAARGLMHYCPDTSWAVVWFAMQKRVDFGRKLIESLADLRGGHNLMAALNESALADLYIWVSEQYPHHEDPEIRGAHIVGSRETISHWRESILEHLKRRGTAESLTAIEKIQHSLPKLEYVKWVLNEARAVKRRNDWTPLQPKDVIALAAAKKQKPTEIQANSGYPEMDDLITKIVAAIRQSAPTVTEDHLSDFVAMLSAIANYSRINLQQRLLRNSTKVKEDKLQPELLYHLRMRLGEGVKEAPKLGGGPTDIQYRSVTAELKVEKKIHDRRKMIEKYLSQLTQYSSADGAQLGILCILDMTVKKTPPANPQNLITLETPDVHGFPLGKAPFPTKIAAVVIEGNLRLPSSYSK